MQSYVSDPFLGSRSAEQWQRIGTNRRVGALLPLASLYSRRTAGIGDLEDLKLAADWCERTGHTILQLLPINDYYNSPYSTFSLFAIDPMYMALDRLIGVPPEKLEPVIRRIQERYPTGCGYIEYDVKHEKINALYEIFREYSLGTENAAYAEFVENNVYWLDDYALYTALKFEYSQDTWENWEPSYREADPLTLREFARKHEVRIRFVQWLQWQLYEQLKAAKAYANAKGILLMGDMFYVVSRDSADVWKRRNYFRLDLVPGLPPEPAHEKGQRWGDQPVYNWDAIRESGDELLKQRLRYNANFYDIARLDTASALFRMWCIPRDEPDINQGLNGFFYPEAMSDYCEQRGKSLLSQMLSSTSMLLCAENLSPACLSFTPSVRELGIPPINFQRWDKEWDELHDFIPPDELHPVTVMVLSNHDTSLWAEWWEGEAGTIEASMFTEFCFNYGLPEAELKMRLFNDKTSVGSKLRWRDSVNSPSRVAEIVGLPEAAIGGFIHDYLNSYREKEKLWEIMKLEGPMRQRADREILKHAIRSIITSNAIWSIVSIVDYLCLLGIIDGDYGNYRLNRPGTERGRNWTWALPVSLEALMDESFCRTVRDSIEIGEAS
ncbi:4-alpha-glucanotransferase [Cohnella faecalis]|nr:4-alpha-glucanotransferase [Cohnella faecalis]